MNNQELLQIIAYGNDGENIPRELLNDIHDPMSTLFKMIRVLAQELLLLESVYEADHSDD